MANIPAPISFDFEGRKTGDPQWEPLIELPGITIRLNVKITTKTLRDYSRDLADAPINVWPTVHHEFLKEVSHPDDYKKFTELNLSMAHELTVCQAAQQLLSSVGVELIKDDDD
ncbi:MAG: hypothetical protein OXG15_04250 [Gammaproteobacteria bacterium]|nr:hypothetical protein [Gammaproteobacteria bacterium]